jgi:tRNA (cmo5U34)-methyltransferase
MNTFEKFQDFVVSDPRHCRTNGYPVTADLLTARHMALLPENLVRNKTVLDIGCCVAATGAWALGHGASHYTGIEIQQDFANIAKKNLIENFSNCDWHIVTSSLEDYIKDATEKFDIVVISSVLHSSVQYQKFIKDITNLAKTAVVVESKTPKILKQLDNHVDRLMIPVTEYSNGKMLYNSTQNLEICTAYPNLGTLKILFADQGFELDHASYLTLKSSHELYANQSRFGAIFKKTGDSEEKNINFYHKNKDLADKLLQQQDTEGTWKFDQDVASSFVEHAKKHIPDYDKVIDLSVKICQDMLPNWAENKIIDVGCATGETINRLHQSGLGNLIGVDNSQSMLSCCDETKAFYVLDHSFPLANGPYKAVICNWTLHFIKNKKDYLVDIFNGLEPGGFLILTEKTVNDGLDLQLYHEHKKKKGVSDKEIQNKASSLVGVMFVDNVLWYLQTLQDIGFSRATVINATPCFTTFLIFK